MLSFSLSRRFFTVFLFIILLTNAFHQYSINAEETTRYGVCLIYSELSDVEVLPKIVFSDESISEGWKLLRDEAYTGLDSHRFYFTIEAPGANLPSPFLTVEWKGVDIERVIGADGFIKTDNGVRFKPLSHSAPTGTFTEISIGAVRLGVFHNWEVRRCGPYREGRYPEVEVKSQLNYMLATLEICRVFGWTETSQPDFVDHINIYGFETSFPNGHRDFPPHFHIMLAWDGWSAAQVGHYLLDADGKIVKNTFWCLHNDLERHDLPRTPTPYVDKTGRLIFTTSVLSNGAGLIISRPDDSVEYLVRPGERGAAESVEVCKRPKQNHSNWQILCKVKAQDDAAAGVFISKAVYADGTTQTVSFKYDPDIGTKLTEQL